MNAVVKEELQRWEHPKGSKIYIREIINLNGGDAYNGSYMVTIPSKVTGSGRKRRQFKTKAKAEKWASEEFSGSNKQGEDYFKLSPVLRRQLVAVAPLLKTHKLTLQEVVDFAVPRLRPEGGKMTVVELVKEMVASKQARPYSKRC